MIPDNSPPGPWWHRRELRLVVAGLSAVLSVYLGFIGVSVSAAATFLKHGGYYGICGTFFLFLLSLRPYVRERSEAWAPLTRRQLGLAAGAIGLFSLLALLAEPFRCKILYDEYVLQSTAFNMHFFRDVAAMVRGYDVQGVFLSTDNYLDKRPIFFPFLISLLHDLTGYRPLNAYLVNAGLMPAALALVFAFGRRLSGWSGGMLAVLLLGSLPLLGQNATGSGMELLNVVMILAVLILMTDYLRKPGEPGATALLLGAVLLAQSRYESVLYVGPVALVLLLGWWREGRIVLPWSAALVPLLLVPSALQNKVVANTPMLWELGEQASTRFSLGFLPKNLDGCYRFLFNTGWEQANSLLLTLAGLAGLVWVAVAAAGFLRRTGLAGLRTADPARLALAGTALAIVGNVLLVFCYYWSNFNDPMAARLCLPLSLLFAFAAVLAAGGLDHRLPLTGILCAVALAYTLGVTTSRYANHFYSHLGIDEIEWTRRFVQARPPGPRLIITNRSTLPWLLDKTPSILIGRARMVADRIDYQLHDANFTEILVMQTLPPTTEDGDHQVLPAERLPGFRLEVLAERRFGTKLVRISRLLSIDEVALAAAARMGRPAAK